MTVLSLSAGCCSTFNDFDFFSDLDFGSFALPPASAVDMMMLVRKAGADQQLMTPITERRSSHEYGT